jgi:hypothetical protein
MAVGPTGEMALGAQDYYDEEQYDWQQRPPDLYTEDEEKK